MQKELDIIRNADTRSGDTKELLSDLTRLESQNASLKGELKELENKHFQDNKEREKDQLKMDKLEKDLIKFKRDVIKR